MDWKKELIYEYNKNYDKSTEFSCIYADCGYIHEFADIDKGEFAKYVSLFDSKQLYDECSEYYVICPKTIITLSQIFMTNYLCFDAYHPHKIKLNLIVGYIKNMLAKLLIFVGRQNYGISMTRRVVNRQYAKYLVCIDRQYAECLVCNYRDYVDHDKIFVCCECVGMCSDSPYEFGMHFFGNEQEPHDIRYTGFGTVKIKEVFDNVHKLIRRCKYVDWGSVLLFVMARDELGVMMDVVRVIVGFVYC